MEENKCTGCHHDVVNYIGVQYTYKSEVEGKHYFIAVTCDRCESYRHLESHMYIKNINHADVRSHIIDMQNLLPKSELEQLVEEFARNM